MKKYSSPSDFYMTCEFWDKLYGDLPWDDCYHDREIEPAECKLCNARRNNACASAKEALRLRDSILIEQFNDEDNIGFYIVESAKKLNLNKLWVISEEDMVNLSASGGIYEAAQAYLCAHYKEMYALIQQHMDADGCYEGFVQRHKENRDELRAEVVKAKGLMSAKGIECPVLDTVSAPLPCPGVNNAYFLPLACLGIAEIFKSEIVSKIKANIK